MSTQSVEEASTPGVRSRSEYPCPVGPAPQQQQQVLLFFEEGAIILSFNIT